LKKKEACPEAAKIILSQENKFDLTNGSFQQQPSPPPPRLEFAIRSDSKFRKAIIMSEARKNQKPFSRTNGLEIISASHVKLCHILQLI